MFKDGFLLLINRPFHLQQIKLLLNKKAFYGDFNIFTT